MTPMQKYKQAIEEIHNVCLCTVQKPENGMNKIRKIINNFLYDENEKNTKPLFGYETKTFFMFFFFLGWIASIPYFTYSMIKQNEIFFMGNMLFVGFPLMMVGLFGIIYFTFKKDKWVMGFIMGVFGSIILRGIVKVVMLLF